MLGLNQQENGYQPKNCERKNNERTTMYIKNRRNSSKLKAFGSCQILCATESLVLLNRLLFIY